MSEFVLIVIVVLSFCAGALVGYVAVHAMFLREYFHNQSEAPSHEQDQKAD
jgi:hypothetical protein